MKETGEEFNYYYDFRGNRAKGETTYYFFGGLYEIQQIPGQANRYTLYIKNGDERIAQWTRTDAVLPNIDASSAFILWDEFPWENLYTFLLVCLVVVWFGYAHQTNKKLFPEHSVTLSLSKYRKVHYAFATSFVALFLLTCASSKDGLPFAAIVSGLNLNTPSVNTEPLEEDYGEGGGGGVGSPGTPAEGMYFMHTDHLNSVTAITDPKGEMVASMDIDSGKSIISYKPYGEIDRKNSSGPDIFRYKYTGQEEDRETGLYYYKARYYDPKIGRFLQPDTYLHSNTAFGMNPYMYVDGNPIMYNDPSGHKRWNAVKAITDAAKKMVKGATGGFRWASRGISGAAHEIASGGKYSRHDGNFFEKAFGSIDISKFLDHATHIGNKPGEGSPIVWPLGGGENGSSGNYNHPEYPEIINPPPSPETRPEGYTINDSQYNNQSYRYYYTYKYYGTYNNLYQRAYSDIVVRYNEPEAGVWDICKVGGYDCTYNGGKLTFDTIQVNETTFEESPGIPHRQCFRKIRYTGNYPYEQPILCEDVE